MPKNDKNATRYKIRRKIPNPVYSLDEIVRPHVLKSPRRPRAKEQLTIATVEAVAPAEAQPFLKWVGGKAQMLAQFDEFFPAQVDRYVEPFIGGGAVFFHLKHRFPQLRAYLRDNNDELINTYKAVRDYPRELMRRLDQHLKEFLADRENYYYCVRAKHHQIPSSTTSKIMKPKQTKLYGYSCDDCRNEVWLMDAPEKFIYCPFCGEVVNDLQCSRVLTIRIGKEKEYESGD